MKVAVDSSVLLDVLLPDPVHQEDSLALLEKHAAFGSMVISPIAYAETAAAFTPTSGFEPIAKQMGLVYDAMTPKAALLAAQMWQDYRRQGGPRSRILAFSPGEHGAPLLARGADGWRRCRPRRASGRVEQHGRRGPRAGRTSQT